MALFHVFVTALIHLFATGDALAAESRKVASSALRSSHGSRSTALRAAGRSNAFRAAVSQGARGGRSKQAPGVPLFVPKIGLANISTPTAMPPPPAVLDPWVDHQPLDTRMGNFFLGGIVREANGVGAVGVDKNGNPTATALLPPVIPTQEMLNLAFGCPLLLAWPLEVSVSAPDPCHHMSSGTWTNLQDKSLIIDWKTKCVDLGSAANPIPSPSTVTTYTIPGPPGSGQSYAFGSSTEVKTLWGKRIELMNCGGGTVYTVEEKVYKFTGKPNRESCKKWGSCDGIIMFQYFVKNAQGKVVAQSGYLNIFQSHFDITDPAGIKIAGVWRSGWDPTPSGGVNRNARGEEPNKCQKDTPLRAWTLKFEKMPPGEWGVATAQWPLAAMMTMLSQRDETRQPDGSVMTTGCEAGKTVFFAVFGILGLLCCICVPLVFFLVCTPALKGFFAKLEGALLSKKMSKPEVKT